jgi:hypothetical protein
MAYSINLTWLPNPASDSVTKYTVYNSTTKAVLATTLPTVQTATITGLTVPTSFYVTATNNTAESLPSNIVAITASLTNVKASLVGDQLTFTWDALPGATSYAIFTGTTEVARVTGTTVTITAVKPYLTYWLTGNGPGISAMPGPSFIVPNPVTDLKVNSLTISP